MAPGWVHSSSKHGLERSRSPGWCGSVGWSIVPRKPKSGFDSQLGHMPTLQVQVQS